MFLAGLTLAILFHSGSVPSFFTALVSFLGLTLFGLCVSRSRQLNLLPRLMILVYSMPFLPLVGYFTTGGDYSFWSSSAARQISDPVMFAQMVTVGLVGLLGLQAGMNIAKSTGMWSRMRIATQAGVNRKLRLETLPIGIYLLSALIAVAVFSLHAQRDTILTTSYASSFYDAPEDKINFPAAYMFGEIVLIMLYIDGECELLGHRRRLKLLSVLGAVAVCSFYFDLLRGRRETAGLLAAVLMLYVTGPEWPLGNQPPIRVQRRRLWKLAPAIATAAALFILIGGVRTVIAPGRPGMSVSEGFLSGFAQNTAAAVLLTNVGMALQYRDGTVHYRLGETYIDYLLSLPPGLITKALGFERPLEETRGPNWWFEIAQGGIHIVVVPFANFGAFGALTILAIYGYLIGSWENANIPGLFWRRLLWASAIVSSMLWFWYGDMPMIRAVMSAALAYLGREICIKVGAVLSVNAISHAQAGGC